MTVGIGTGARTDSAALERRDTMTMIKLKFWKYLFLYSAYLLAVLIIADVNAGEINCKKHTIYCQIKKNRSELDDRYAMKLSNVIWKMGKRYKIPTNIYTAILMQESLYRLQTNGCHDGLIVTETEEGHVEYEETRICSDFGISQIYYKTAKGFKLDIERLTSDLEYSVEAGAMVLHDFMKRYSKREKDWWTRYNASSKDKRRIYKVLVERFL